MGDFLRIPMDERDLNYNRFFTEGEQLQEQARDYDSHSTEQLTMDELKELLLSLPEIQEELKQVGRFPVPVA